MTTTQTWTITGMTCGHCVASVTREMQTIPGVEDVTVDLPTGTVAVRSAEPISDGAVKTAVEEAGYRLA